MCCAGTTLARQAADANASTVSISKYQPVSEMIELMEKRHDRNTSDRQQLHL
jgi:hypothetical protein